MRLVTGDAALGLDGFDDAEQLGGGAVAAGEVAHGLEVFEQLGAGEVCTGSHLAAAAAKPASRTPASPATPAAAALGGQILAPAFTPAAARPAATPAATVPAPSPAARAIVLLDQYANLDSDEKRRAFALVHRAELRAGPLAKHPGALAVIICGKEPEGRLLRHLAEAKTALAAQIAAETKAAAKAEPAKPAPVFHPGPTPTNRSSRFNRR